MLYVILVLKNAYGIIIKLIAGKLSIRKWCMQQFFNFLLRQRVERQNGSRFHCLMINWQSTAQTSLIKVSNLCAAAFYPLVACVVCCLNQITRRWVNYRSRLHTITPKLAPTMDNLTSDSQARSGRVMIWELVSHKWHLISQDYLLDDVKQAFSQRWNGHEYRYIVHFPYNTAA